MRIIDAKISEIDGGYRLEYFDHNTKKHIEAWDKSLLHKYYDNYLDQNWLPFDSLLQFAIYKARYYGASDDISICGIDKKDIDDSAMKTIKEFNVCIE